MNKKEEMGNILLILKNKKTGKMRTIKGKNLITDAGDIFYTQKALGETPTNNFANLYLASAGPLIIAKNNNFGDFTVMADSERAPSAGYPKNNDDDDDNTEAGITVISYKFEYNENDGPFEDVTHHFIAKAAASGIDPILCAYEWETPWNKDVGVVATMFVNHEILGTEA